MGFEEGVFGGFDDLGGVADDGAEEFFFGDLFEVGEAEFGEEFLRGWWSQLVGESQDREDRIGMGR